MINLIIVGDIHSADKNPSSRIGDYFEDVFEKLKQIAVMAEKTKADAVLFLGDLFHKKQQRENSCRLIATWIDILKLYPQAYAIAGNHDEAYNNPDTIPDQPIGVLEASGHLFLLDERFKKSKIFEKPGLKVRIAGYPYEPSRKLEACQIQRGDEDILICLVHIYAGPKKKDFFGDIIHGYNEMESFDPDIFCFGHYHVDQGIHRRNNKYFVNLGAITRGSLAQDDLKREPKVAWIQIENKTSVKIRQIKLKVKPVKDIFDLQMKAEVDAEDKEINKYVEKLKEELNETKVETSIDEQIIKMNIDQEVKDTIYYYLEKAGLEKTKIETSNILESISFEDDENGDS